MSQKISPQDWLSENKGKTLNDYFNAFPQENTKEENRIDVQNKQGMSRSRAISIIIACIAITVITLFFNKNTSSNNLVAEIFSNKIDSSSDLYNTEWEDESHSVKMKFAGNTNACLMTLIKDGKTLDLSFDYALFNDQIELQAKEDFAAIFIPAIFGTVQSIKIKINSDNSLTLPVKNNKIFILTPTK